MSAMPPAAAVPHHRPRAQESENEQAEVVIVCEPEQASLMMGGLHPRGSLYERPVNIDTARAQHAEFRALIREHGVRVLTVREILAYNVRRSGVLRRGGVGGMGRAHGMGGDGVAAGAALAIAYTVRNKSGVWGPLVGGGMAGGDGEGRAGDDGPRDPGVQREEERRLGGWGGRKECEGMVWRQVWRWQSPAT